MSSDRRLFQVEPERFSSSHGRHRPKGWTESVQSYLVEAKRELSCLVANERLLGRPYTWLITLNITEVMKAHEVNRLWAMVARRLRRAGVVGYRVAEVNADNLVHFHLLLSSQHTETELRDIVDEASADLPLRKHMEQVRSSYGTAGYILKAQVEGMSSNGKRVLKDKHGSKRTLFQPHTGIRKIGVVGKFFVKSKTELRAEMQKYAKQQAEAMKSLSKQRLVNHLFGFFGGYYSRAELTRLIAKHGNEEAFRSWADKLKP